MRGLRPHTETGLRVLKRAFSILFRLGAQRLAGVGAQAWRTTRFRTMHMKMIRIFVVFVCCLMATFGSAAATTDPDELARHIYLGQLYPSGNIYLVPFPFPGASQSEDDYRKAFQWPESLFFHSLASIDPYAGKTQAAHFSGALHDAVVGNVYQTTYIPSLESMDDEHNACDERPRKPKNSHYLYLGEDFFNQVLDNCNAAEGTSIYKAEQNTGVFSYAVVAFDKEIPLSEFRIWKDKRRPLTRAEAASVATEKREFRKTGSDCYTNPSFLDDAVMLMTAKVTGTDISIRLSKYQNPGCEGHLATYYVLDVLKAGALVKTYELTQYVGLI